MYKSDSISEIHSEIKSIQKTGNPKQPLIVNELWKISVCGKNRYYPISMRSDKKEKLISASPLVNTFNKKK